MIVVLILLASWAALILFAVSLGIAAARGDRVVLAPAGTPVELDWFATVAPATSADRVTPPVAPHSPQLR